MLTLGWLFEVRVAMSINVAETLDGGTKRKQTGRFHAKKEEEQSIVTPMALNLMPI